MARPCRMQEGTCESTRTHAVTLAAQVRSPEQTRGHHNAARSGFGEGEKEARRTGGEEQETRDVRDMPPLLRELLLDELLSSPCSCFCRDGSSELSRLSACSLKWSAKPQNALWTKG